MLIWSPQALLDVQHLYRFLTDKNQDAAKRAVTTIRQGVQVLTNSATLEPPSLE